MRGQLLPPLPFAVLRVLLSRRCMKGRSPSCLAKQAFCGSTITILQMRTFSSCLRFGSCANPWKSCSSPCQDAETGVCTAAMSCSAQPLQSTRMP
eukprot:6392226-Alexandrium_andersonii.AAC.1